MSEKTAKIPCHKCGEKKVEYGDCGYTTSNPGWVRCLRCGFEVKVSDCDCSDPWITLNKKWEQANKNIRVNSLEQLKKLLKSKQPIESCSMTLHLKDLKDLIKLKDDIDGCHRALDEIEGYESKKKGSASLLKRIKKLTKEIKG